MIESFNAAGDKPFNVSVNKFADLTHEEFKKFYLVSFLNYESTTAVSDSLDWRVRNGVTLVREQGPNCGSCWSFSALAAVESSYLLKYGDPYDLSEQQLMECDYTDHNRACNMGYMTEAYDYIIANGGVTTEQNYPYVAGRQYCDRIKAAQPVAQLAYYQLVPPNSEAALIQAVNMARICWP
ncbi:hypothetical protein GH714_031303 [Hevea brasiliensis]|uniref:Peptidase C1A papain C-terminal domain-containing protein n=1 Tax=Hevea brasiliensis TaxID=3981 RepID=A0A6A6L3P3_HEVBR|nr:hypothetical protein GH714_031303 [Hevea brasiliensis]